jgi:hypothetical protein
MGSPCGRSEAAGEVGDRRHEGLPAADPRLCPYRVTGLKMSLNKP